MTGSRIVSLGSALPQRVVASDELEHRLGLPQGWIRERTGIRERRVASTSETTSMLGAAAAQEALDNARLRSDDIDLVICATVTPDRVFPATACSIQSALGMDAAAFDINAGCSGFLFGLAQADASIRAGLARRVLVVGVDVLSRITDWDDPKSAVLFGDGAGAAVVAAHDVASLGPFDLHADGSRPELLFVRPDTGRIHMEGREVYRAAVTAMSRSVERVLARSRHEVGDVNLVVAHQANARILEGVARRANLHEAKMFCNIDRFGNTSAASIPLALADAEDEGALRDGDRLVVTAFGAGFTWGSVLIHWIATRRQERLLVAAGASDA